MNISICLATYRRPERLSLLLEDLVSQEMVPGELVIVDNDPYGSAACVVERRRLLGTPFPIHYEIQPVQNISLTRNRAVALSRYDWIAFVDDDERAPSQWLRDLSRAAVRFEADCVLGPVVPVLPDRTPSWIRLGTFYDWPRLPSGSIVAANRLRFGNVLIRGAWLRDTDRPFDPDFGRTGGEDGDLLTRLVRAGLRVIWCNEAVVYEPVMPNRLTLRWLLLRSMRGGQDFARHKMNGRFGPLSITGRLAFFMRALLQAALAGGLALLSFPRGRHRAAFWLLKASANLGKLSVLAGAAYEEYGGKIP